MAKPLRTPRGAMPDSSELDLFFETWEKALGPNEMQRSPTEAWLRAFGAQTKWMGEDSWAWWLEEQRPPDQVDISQAKGFLSLLIGMLGQHSPSGQAIRYAREMVDFLD